MLFSLLSRWKHIDPEDALLLLLPEFSAEVVREHAVDALRRASDAELQMYLLQLVQVSWALHNHVFALYA